MDGEFARVVHLPVPAAAPNPDAVFAEMLAGWRRLQLSQGFPAGLDLHSFRRSYVTHLVEFYAFQQTFIQKQLGHEHASTTSIYTLVSDDYQVRELNRVLENTLADATRPANPWEKPT